jgi:hypothetical protein
MKINFFKKENNFKKKDFSFNTNFYWKLAVAVASVGVLWAFFFGYNLFMQINQESSFLSANPGTQIPTVDQNRLNKDLNYFSDRQRKSADILNSPSPVVDPSL